MFITYKFQARKTLHAHFLLWIKNWHQLLEGLANPLLREQYEQQMKMHASSIASVKFHDKFEEMECANNSCQSKLSSSIATCTDQDLRNLRCAKGTTEFGDKNILKCMHCGKVYNSDELATIAIDKRLNLNLPAPNSDEGSLSTDSIWTPGTRSSKRGVIMELKLIHTMIK